LRDSSIEPQANSATLLVNNYFLMRDSKFLFCPFVRSLNQKAEFENLKGDNSVIDLEGGLLTREEVLGFLQPNEVIFSNHTDKNRVSAIVAKCRITHRFKIMFGPLDKKRKSMDEHEKPRGIQKKTKMTSSPSLFQIYELEEKVVTKTVAQHLPQSQKKNALQVGHFFLFCHERQMVWEKRNCGAALPWTRSKALAGYYFCNVSCALFIPL
jgi:hypothetical protein